MKDSELKDLLLQADTQGNSIFLNGPLLQEKALRRRRVRHGIGFVAIMIFVSSLLWWVYRIPDTAAVPGRVANRPSRMFVAGPTTHSTPPADTVTLASVDISERIATETAIGIAQRRRSGAMAPRGREAAREMAAETLLRAGNRRLLGSDTVSATAAYHAAAVSFPDTQAGQRAHTALQQLQ